MSGREHPLGRLLRYAGDRGGAVLAASAASILNKVFDLAPPVLLGIAVEVLLHPASTWLAPWVGSEARTQLLWLGGLTLVVFFFESLFEYLYGLLWRGLAQDLQHRLRLDAFDHVLVLDRSWLESRSTADVMAVLNDDVNQLERFLDEGANEILHVATTVVMIGGAYLWLSPWLALLAALPIPVILAGAFGFQGRLGPRYAAVRERAGWLNAVLSSALGGLPVVQAFTAERREAERLERASSGYREANRDAIRLSTAFSPLIRMVIVVGFVSTLVVGGELVLAGRLAVGSFSVLVFLSQRLLWPLARLARTVDLYQRAMASTRRIFELLDTPVRLVDGGLDLPGARARGELAFEGVTFAYPGREPAIHGLSFSVAPGEMVGIVGATGAGKTTLLRLLLRFYDPSEGRIRLDGIDLRELRLGALRGAFGLVSQDVFLFPGSVEENVRYGRPGASEAELEEACRLAEAHGFVTGLPQGYRTQVGERGVKLSGGQAQRLALARAILRDPEVLLLDEATSAVDNETEAAIQRSLARVAHGRTVLAIAHRLSTVRHADRILVLERGRLVEQGRHDALVAAGGVYAGLWKVQTGEGVDPEPGRAAGSGSAS